MNVQPRHELNSERLMQQFLTNNIKGAHSTWGLQWTMKLTVRRDIRIGYCPSLENMLIIHQVLSKLVRINTSECVQVDEGSWKVATVAKYKIIKIISNRDWINLGWYLSFVFYQYSLYFSYVHVNKAGYLPPFDYIFMLLLIVRIHNTLKALTNYMKSAAYLERLAA